MMQQSWPAGACPRSPIGPQAGESGPVYFGCQVSPRAELTDTTPPKYPAILFGAGFGGRAIVQFVVDTAGRAELGTIKVIESTHELFLSSVKSTLSVRKWRPALLRGRPVRQLVARRADFGTGDTVMTCKQAMDLRWCSTTYLESIHWTAY